MSQAGLQPIRAGRFTVHTPDLCARRGAINFEIDASLAFGTGQHATTSGCLAALDSWSARARPSPTSPTSAPAPACSPSPRWRCGPRRKCIATDIDPIAIDVARDNAAINGVKLGHGAGELLLGVADGMDSPLLAARAPFDLIVANILAGPLIELAPDFAAALAPGGTLVLAGLLDSQADGVIAAYEELGLSFTTAASASGRCWSANGPLPRLACGRSGCNTRAMKSALILAPLPRRCSPPP